MHRLSFCYHCKYVNVCNNENGFVVDFFKFLLFIHLFQYLQAQNANKEN